MPQKLVLETVRRLPQKRRRTLVKSGWWGKDAQVTARSQTLGSPDNDPDPEFRREIPPEQTSRVAHNQPENVKKSRHKECSHRAQEAVSEPPSRANNQGVNIMEVSLHEEK
jgi:hypothetical protein